MEASIYNLIADAISVILNTSDSCTRFCLTLTSKIFRINGKKLSHQDVIRDSLTNEAPTLFLYCKEYLKYNDKQGEVCNILAEHGNLVLLEWAHNMKYFWNSETYQPAILRDNLEVIKYLWTHSCGFTDLECEMAGRKGNLEIVKHFHSCWRDDYYLTTRVCIVAIEHGHSEIIKYFIENNHVVLMTPLFTSAAGCGNLEMLKYLSEHYSDWDKDRCRLYAQNYKHNHIVEWIESQD